MIPMSEVLHYLTPAIAVSPLLVLALLWDYFARGARRLRKVTALALAQPREPQAPVIPAQRTSSDRHAGPCECGHLRTILDGAVYCGRCTTDPTSNAWTSPYKGGEVA